MRLVFRDSLKRRHWLAKQLCDSLTERELVILKGLAESFTVRAIALDLGLSAKTIEYYRTKLYRKLKLNDLPGLTRFAVRAGLVEA